MPEFEVVYEGQVREVYVVTADSEEEARRIWVDVGDLVQSEVTDGEIYSVEEIAD